MNNAANNTNNESKKGVMFIAIESSESTFQCADFEFDTVEMFNEFVSRYLAPVAPCDGNTYHKTQISICFEGVKFLDYRLDVTASMTAFDLATEIEDMPNGYEIRTAL